MKNSTNLRRATATLSLSLASCSLLLSSSTPDNRLGELLLPVGEIAIDGHLADFNEDSIPDFVVSTDQKIYQYTGKGDGSFELSQTFFVAGQFSLFSVADATNDGHQDITFIKGTTVVGIFPGKGNGAFGPLQMLPTNLSINVVEVDDFTQDNIPDVFTMHSDNNIINIFPGQGDGTFGAPIILPVGQSASILTAKADLDKNGAKDIIVLNGFGQSVSVILNNGDGSFQPTLFLPSDNLPDKVSTGDFNGDSNLDIAVSNLIRPAPGAFSFTCNLTVYPGNGDGTLQTPRSFYQNTEDCGFGISLQAGDINGDGLDDLMATDFGTGVPLAFLGSATDILREPKSFAPKQFPVFTFLMDINDDNKLDFLTLNLGSNDLGILVGLGDGDFEETDNVLIGGETRTVLKGDFNQNGKTDLGVLAIDRLKIFVR